MSRTEPWCPTCVVALTPRLHERRPVWWCLQCFGTFLPVDQLRDIARDAAIPRPRELRLQELTAAASGPHPVELLAPPTACPWCARPMRRAAWEETSAVVVDECDSGCGVWLDGGELERVEAWTEAVTAGLIRLPHLRG